MTLYLFGARSLSIKWKLILQCLPPSVVARSSSRMGDSLGLFKAVSGGTKGFVAAWLVFLFSLPDSGEVYTMPESVEAAQKYACSESCLLLGDEICPGNWRFYRVFTGDSAVCMEHWRKGHIDKVKAIRFLTARVRPVKVVFCRLPRCPVPSIISKYRLLGCLRNVVWYGSIRSTLFAEFLLQCSAKTWKRLASVTTKAWNLSESRIKKEQS